MSNDRAEKAKHFLESILPDGSLESLGGPKAAFESLRLSQPVPSEHQRAAESATRKLAAGEELTPPEQFALEAIIIPDKRPVVDIVNGDYEIVHPLWTSFETDVAMKMRIRKAIPSIGRIELPHHPTLPYGGTGFVVGSGLLMTNRHVAEIFSSGLGVRHLAFRQGQAAGIDFLREKDNPATCFLKIREVVMIHPYWDMALLRVEGISAAQAPLALSLQHPEGLADRDVAVIGYPAFDPRNDTAVQNSVFGGVYYVTRLQPGKLKPRESVESFGKLVSAATHDSSTLGGNSGSAVLDVGTGQVIALHFAGEYLKANYAVPTSELARDARVVDAGVNFQPPSKADPDVWKDWWQMAEATSPAPPRSAAPDQVSGPSVKDGDRNSSEPSRNRALSRDDSATWTIPIEITIRVGGEPSVALPRARPAASTANEVVPAREKPARNRRALEEGPLTFRNHFISLYQSAVADVAKKIAADTKVRRGTEAPSSDPAADLILAAERVAYLRSIDSTDSHSGATSLADESAMLERMSTLDHAKTCASLGLQLMQAKVLGDTRSAERIEGQLRGSSCDPRWAKTIEEYVKYYFKPSGARRDAIYVEPTAVGNKVLTIKPNARIGIIGDWGTGAAPARRILQQIKAQNPDILIHLGDIYYSGTDNECRSNFEAVVNEVFDRAKTRLPVFTLAGNHDMYCGGVGYYSLIKRLNKGPMLQPASFFCLRANDDSWQILAMDTGRHDYNPFSVTDVVTFVESTEQDWHRQRLQEFSGKTILLSHHQLFSAFSQIGKPTPSGKLRAYNPQLQATYDYLCGTGKRIAAWFWGHEHNLCIYQPYNNLRCGRCIGHSAIPVFIADTPYDPLPNLDNPPQLIPNTMLTAVGEFYPHGFTMLTLGEGAATAEYFEDLSGDARKLYSETIT
jgi:hypothetical protein